MYRKRSGWKLGLNMDDWLGNFVLLVFFVPHIESTAVSSDCDIFLWSQQRTISSVAQHALLSWRCDHV